MHKLSPEEISMIVVGVLAAALLGVALYLLLRRTDHPRPNTPQYTYNTLKSSQNLYLRLEPELQLTSIASRATPVRLVYQQVPTMSGPQHVRTLKDGHGMFYGVDFVGGVLRVVKTPAFIGFANTPEGLSARSLILTSDGYLGQDTTPANSLTLHNGAPLLATGILGETPATWSRV